MLIGCLEFFRRSLPELPFYVTTQKQMIFSCLVVMYVGPSPLTKMNIVENFLMETLVLQIELRLSDDAFCRMYL